VATSTSRNGTRTQASSRNGGDGSPSRGDRDAGRNGGGYDSPSGLQGLIERRRKGWKIGEPDHEFFGRQRHFWNFVNDHYFRMEIGGWHRLPDGPCMLVGVHASSVVPMEAWSFVQEWWRHFGRERILHGTTHDALFVLPGIGDYFRRLGVIPASPESISAAFAAGHDAIVWPGGELDAFRAWTKRDHVVLGGRVGFVRQAITSGVPIVPVAATGGSDTVIVLSEGRRLAQVLGLKKLLRAEVLPITFGLPLGFLQTVLPAIPMPAKLRLEILDPVEVDHDPERAGDKRYVKTKFRQVERRLQQGVDELAKRRSFPIFG
jgi:1-acyl-sn-glycerol-3-phosphate acyltransferase